MVESQTNSQMSQEALDDLVAKTDTGARRPDSPSVARLMIWTAIAWSMFQIWFASPLPYILGLDFLVFNDAQARAIHLAFALFLGYLAYPALKSSPRRRVPLQDWALAIIGGFCAFYKYIFYDSLSARAGLPETLDIAISAIGILLLLEAVRRALGPVMTVLGIICILYIFGGNASFIPDVIRYQGATLERGMEHLWLTDQGVFGIALGVSTKFVFLFVLFGALLDRAGAGNYFIKVAFSLLGHLRGGPAKAAVVSSGMTGLISGSSIANVVTTGTFTMPLMKRVGFSPEKAGAVEVASSVNGQIMPPVMGAAAFLMTEYVGIEYQQLIKHAFLPAIISYIALLYIVHLEALKAGMQGLQKPYQRPWYLSAIVFGLVAASFIILSWVAYHSVAWIKPTFGEAAPWVIACLLGAVYVVLSWFASRFPVLEVDDPNQPVTSLPRTAPVVCSGLHFLLPIVVLVWCLMVERLSPATSAFWATAFMIFIVLTQKPLQNLFRRSTSMLQAAKEGLCDLYDGLAAGGRNMISIGLATAAAGIIVGTVSLTGVGLVMTQLIEFLSAGNVIFMLFWVALICLILGMGLPTTANYLVVAILMAPVVVELGAANGYIFPLVAVHLFVFYFGIMADVTPPVGLASFAASAISGGDPIRTGLTAFYYSLRTVALPFIFLFNPQLLLIGIEDTFHLILTISSATLAMLVFAAALQGFWVVRSRIYETLLLLLVAFSLFRPGFWMEMIYPSYEELPGSQVYEVVENAEIGDSIQIHVEGEDFVTGEFVERAVQLPIVEGETGRERIENLGLTLLSNEDNQPVVDLVQFGSQAEQIGFDFDQVIASVDRPLSAPDKEWIFIPALFLLALVYGAQKLRQSRGREHDHAGSITTPSS